MPARTVPRVHTRARRCCLIAQTSHYKPGHLSSGRRYFSWPSLRSLNGRRTFSWPALPSFAFLRGKKPAKKKETTSKITSLNYQEILQDPREIAYRYLGNRRSPRGEDIALFLKYMNSFIAEAARRFNSTAALYPTSSGHSGSASSSDIEKSAAETRPKLPRDMAYTALWRVLRVRRAPLLSYPPKLRRRWMHIDLCSTIRYPKASTISDINAIFEQYRVSPSLETLTMLIRRLSIFHYDHLALCAFHAIPRMGLRPSVYTHTSMLSYFLERRKYTNFVSLLERIRRSDNLKIIATVNYTPIFVAENIECFGAIFNGFIKFGQFDLANAFFLVNSRVHGYNLQIWTMLLSLKIAQRDFKGGYQAVSSIIQWCKEREMELDSWCVYHIILLFEASGNKSQAHAMRKLAGASPLFGHFTAPRPWRIFRFGSGIFPWRNKRKIFAEDPSRSSFVWSAASRERERLNKRMLGL